MRQSQAPGARHSPLPPCSRAWRGGTRAPADARCSVRSAPLRPGASAAHRLPASPPYAPETRRLRRTYGAPLRRPRASRGVHGASGPASPAAAPPRKWTPAAGPGRPSPPPVRCRPDGRSTSGADAQASGPLRPVRLQQPRAPPPRSQARSHRAAQPQSRPRAHRSPMQFYPQPILRTGCHLCFPMAVRGRLDYFPPWYKNCLMQ